MQESHFFPRIHADNVWWEGCPSAGLIVATQDNQVPSEQICAMATLKRAARIFALAMGLAPSEVLTFAMP